MSMMSALESAASNLNAQSLQIQNIAHDLANVNTHGYKRSEIVLADLPYQTITTPGSALGDQSLSPLGTQIGTGVRVAGNHKIFDAGPIQETGNAYDLMIDGPGFFPVMHPQTKEIVYVRTGAFHPNSQGILQMSNGAQLSPQISIPTQAAHVSIQPTGEVKAILPDGNETSIGQIQTVLFQNERGLIPLGQGLYKASLSSGSPQPGIPGNNAWGPIHQGALEASNVNVANSMVKMITGQRAYEMGAKVMGVVDQMLSSTINIK